MNYIYDIVLNFNSEFYEFFEWKKSDKILNVKKVPAFRISSEDINKLKYNVIRVDKTFLDKFFELTLFYSKFDSKYICLVSDTNASIGLMFDSKGNLIKRSSLVFDEEEEVNEEVVRDDIINIDYLVNKKKNIEYMSRFDKERRDYLLKFINNLDIESDSNIFKYMYYDYFETEEEDVGKIKEMLINEINDINSNKNRLFELVKILKKIKN